MSEHSPEPVNPAGSSWGQSQGHIPSANVQATMTQMTSQLQTVIDAAERAAEAIRFDAEEQARHHLAEAQRKADRLTAERVGLISDLTDDLIRHAATVRDHSEQMIRALEDAISSVTTKLEQPELTESIVYTPSAAAAIPGQATLGAVPSPASAYSAPAVAPPPAVAPAASPAPAATPTPAPAPVAAAPAPAASSARPVASQPVSEEALLHATRLAVAGTDRATIAAALREGYGVADPDPLVARVLGEA